MLQNSAFCQLESLECSEKVVFKWHYQNVSNGVRNLLMRSILKTFYMQRERLWVTLLARYACCPKNFHVCSEPKRTLLPLIIFRMSIAFEGSGFIIRRDNTKSQTSKQ